VGGGRGVSLRGYFEDLYSLEDTKKSMWVVVGELASVRGYFEGLYSQEHTKKACGWW